MGFSSEEYAQFKNKTALFVCPFCGARNNRGLKIRYVDVLENILSCSHCDSRWKETYELTGYIKLK